VATALQCVAHELTGDWDLAAIPPHRRGRFEITRTKYARRRRPHAVLAEIGGVPSLLGLLGDQRSRYRFSTDTDPARALLRELPAGDRELEILELYSLDRVQQWNLDRPAVVRGYYARIDDFLGRLVERCRSRGVLPLLLSDHGHEAVRHQVDVRGALERLRADGLSSDDYDLFVELPIARFWFHTPKARELVSRALSGLPHSRVAWHRDLCRYQLPTWDDRYGECFLIAEPGAIFFPHDFHHPLANLYLGLTDAKQRRRILDPVQRSNHGYLPQHECEQGFLLAFDERCEARRELIELIDVAPTVLALLGQPQPPSMTGTPAFDLS
jgi:hypothetical protein